MKYTIGEFADILGVTADTLRLYEKYGIINPLRDDKNNYRYFDDLDARDLLISRWYRSLQISLQDTAILTKDSSLEEILEKIQETKKDLEAEIKKKNILLKKVTEVIGEFEEIKSSLNKCVKKKIPGIYRIEQTSNNILLQDNTLTGIVNTWMDTLPHTFYSFKIDKEKILTNKNSFKYSWGLAIYEDEIADFNFGSSDNVEYIKPKVYLSSIILSSYEEYITKDSLQFMIDYIKNNNYSIIGNVIGKIIFVEKSKGDNKSYLQVNIPIQ